MAQPRLHTERLVLVPLAEEHLPFEIELDSEPEVMRYITGRALSPVEVEQAHRRRLAAANEVPADGGQRAVSVETARCCEVPCLSDDQSGGR